MRLVKNWRALALRSHSMRSQYAGVLALIMPEALFAGLGYDLASPQLWWWVGLSLIVAGMLGRIVDQGIGGGQ